jgi:dolichyl-phosphate beta-glucosyltransferase
MPEAIELTLILPAYNERSSIARTIEEAFAYFKRRNIPAEIIVAADGNDGTREIVRKMSAENPNLRVIGHEERRGKGRGIREAVRLARGRIVGYADADNKVPIEEYEKIERELIEHQLVTGSRGMAASQIDRPQPWYRRIGSKAFYYFLQSILGLPGVRDTQCGFKFFHREVAVYLFSLQQIDGYMFDVEILMIAHRLGIRIKEVPIRWRDDNDSRLQLLSGNLRNAIDIFKIRLRWRGIDPAPAGMFTAPNNE